MRWRWRLVEAPAPAPEPRRAAERRRAARLTGPSRSVPVAGGNRAPAGPEVARLSLRRCERVLLVVVHAAPREPVGAARVAPVAAADGPPVGVAGVPPAATGEIATRRVVGARRASRTASGTGRAAAAAAAGSPAPLALVLVPASARRVVPPRVQVGVRLGVRRVGVRA